MNDTVSLQQENQTLRDQLAEQDQHLQEKDICLKEQSQRIVELEELLRLFNRKTYGASSEQNAQQGQLFDEAEAIDEQDSGDEETVTVPTHSRKARRVSIPAHIPREEIIHDLPDDEKVCPHDGTALKRIGEETHEQLDIIPAKVKCLRHIRLKYACPCCERYIITAKKPKQPIEKSLASPGLLAFVATSKYADALPLYRQSEMFKRSGIELDKASLANWMIRCGQLVQPLINRWQDHLQEQAVLHMDETTVQVLNEPDKTPQSKSYMWVMTNTGATPIVLFHYANTRRRDIPLQLLDNYSGALVVDGYEGYQAVCDQNTLHRLGCWAHARRKFVDAQRVQPKGKTGKADQALAFIQKLYAVEKQAKGQPPDERYRIRQDKAQPIIDKLKAWLEKSLPNTPPKTALGKALYYLHKQWPRLTGYLENGLYPIDNNRAENAIRPFVIGRKNWLFSNSVRGAKASANLYSLIETAKANGLNPYDYLKRVFTDLPNAETLEDVDALLPWNNNVNAVVG